MTPAHGNFRPGAFLFWKTWLVLFGAEKPSAFALFNLLAHSLNALLVGVVLRRFRAPAVLAWSAAAVFLLFPPANEALFWMSGGHYTYGMTFLLLAVVSVPYTFATCLTCSRMAVRPQVLRACNVLRAHRTPVAAVSL